MTRVELYELIWSTPITQLARKYGLSDNGFAKICKKHDIPRPPRGYWAKLRFDKAPSQTPLPDPKRDYDIEMRDELNPAEQRSKKNVPVAPSISISPSEDLRSAHPLIRTSRDKMERVDPDHRGFLQPPEGCLDIYVSKKCLRRSLLLLDGLLKGLSEMGHDVCLTDEGGTVVTIDGTTVGFGIEEGLMTVRKELKDHDLSGRYTFAHDRFNEERVPSGKLCLAITEWTAYGQSTRNRALQDGAPVRSAAVDS